MNQHDKNRVLDGVFLPKEHRLERRFQARQLLLCPRSMARGQTEPPKEPFDHRNLRMTHEHQH
jgi:hypothetical protein